MRPRSLCLLMLLWLAGVSLTTTIAAEPPSDELLNQIIQLIGDKDREFRAAGLEQVRTGAKGEAATKFFASQVTKLDAAGQAALLSALADRGDVAARPAVLAIIVASKEATVRAAAVAALGKLGGVEDLPLLIKSLSGSEVNAARQALIQMAGETTSQSIAESLKTAPASVKSQLIDVLATRRATGELTTFIEATLDDDPQVRSTAMNALGQLGDAEQVALLMPGVLKSAPGNERANAERNVAAICARIVDEKDRAKLVIDALDKVSPKDRDQLLSLVGRVGGSTLIDFVGNIATGENAARRRLGIDALSKWPDASVADKLLEIATKATDRAERSLAFQGFVKVSATRDMRNDKQRLERMKQALQAAKTPEEKSLVINRTRTAYDVESLRFVLPFIDQPQFAQITCETIVEIAHHRAVRDPHKAEFDKALDKVIKISKDPVVIDRAQRYKRGETWERPKK